jgi:hypothetical protein
VMIQTKFGFHWSSTFRGEDFWKSLRLTTDGRRQLGSGELKIEKKTIYFSKYYHYSYFPNRGDVQVHMKRRKQNLRFT